MMNKLTIQSLATIILACFAVGCEHERKPWTVYYSGQTGNTDVYYKYTDANGKLSSSSFETRKGAETLLEVEILAYQRTYAKRVWREVTP